MANVPNNTVDNNRRDYQRTIADCTMSKIYTLRRLPLSVKHELGAWLVRNEAPDTFHHLNCSKPVKYHKFQTARQTPEKIRHKYKPCCEESSKFRTALPINPKRTRTQNCGETNRNCGFKNELFQYYGPRFAAIEKGGSPAPLEPVPNYSNPMNFPTIPAGHPQYETDNLKYERYGHKCHDWLRQAEQADTKSMLSEVMDPIAPAYQITDLRAAFDSPCSPPESNPNSMPYLTNLGSRAPRRCAGYDDNSINNGFNQPAISTCNAFDCYKSPGFIPPEGCQRVSNILPLSATPEYSPHGQNTYPFPNYTTFTQGLAQRLIQSGSSINPTANPYPTFNQTQPCSHTSSGQSGSTDPCSISHDDSTRYEAFKNDIKLGGGCPLVKNLTMENLNDTGISSNCPHHRPFSEPTCSRNLNESQQAPCRRGKEFSHNLQLPDNSFDNGLRTQFVEHPLSTNLQSNQMRTDSTPQGPVTEPASPDSECKTPDLENETIANTVGVALRGLDDITKTLKRKNPLKCLKDMESLSDREKFYRLVKENIAQAESNFILIRDKVKTTLCDISRIIVRQTALQFPELKPIFEEIEKKCDRSGDLKGATDQEAYTTLITSTVRGFERMTSALKLAPKTKALDEIATDSDKLNELLNHMANETNQSFKDLQSATKDILKEFERISTNRSDLIKRQQIHDLIELLEEEEEEEHSCGIRNIKNKTVGKTTDKADGKTIDKTNDKTNDKPNDDRKLSWTMPVLF